MKKLLPLISLLFLFTNLFAQSAISGKVVNGVSHQPLPFATVTLLKAADSTLVKGTLGDSAGNYLYEHILPGSYLVCVTAIGMQKKYSSPFQFTNEKSLAIDDIQLTPLAKTLDKVTVEASKPMFEQKPGMLIVNTGSSIVSDGNSALDILRKSPGVYIDENGSISLKGKPGVMVMIDDRPTYLSAEQLSIYLKNLPASSIQQIEIMSTPPARYDAEGSAGIINIRMKKNAAYGFNGRLNGTLKQWNYSNVNGGLTLNYRNNKMNLYANYNYNNYHPFIHSALVRRFYNADTLSTILTQNRVTQVPGQSHSFKVGADFYLGKNSTLGFIVSGLVNNEKNNVTNTGYLSNQLDELQNTSLSNINYQNKFDNQTYDLNYKTTLDTNTTLAFTFDYSKYNTSSLEDYNTNYYNISGADTGSPTIWKGSQPSVITIKSGKVDFSHSFKHDLQLEAGGKLSQVNSDNNMLFQDYINGEWINDTGITNHFKYVENINAIYADITKGFNKGWGIQIGLRGEQTIVKGMQLTDNDNFTRNYFQLFPTLFIKKDYSNKNELSLSYSRRIDRPDYQSLNPFRFYVDPYTYREGNPDLKPQITNDVSLSGIYKGFLTITLDASRTSGAFADIIRQVDTANLTIQYQENLNTLDNLSLTISAPYSPFKWWQTTNFINLYYNSSTGNYLNSVFVNKKTTIELSSNNTFILSKGLSAELNAYYRSPQAFSIFELGSTADVSAGIKKYILNKKASIKLSANDIFYTTHTKAMIHYADLDIQVDHRWDSRTINLSITFIFGNTKVRSENYKNGIEDEQQRVKKSQG